MSTAYFLVLSTIGRGVFRGGGLVGAPPPRGILGGGASPWIFRISRERAIDYNSSVERALSLTTAIEKETKRKKVREKKKYIVSGVMTAKETPPQHPLSPPSYISLSPFLPFFYEIYKWTVIIIIEEIIVNNKIYWEFVVNWGTFYLRINIFKYFAELIHNIFCWSILTSTDYNKQFVCFFLRFMRFDNFLLNQRKNCIFS